MGKTMTKDQRKSSNRYVSRDRSRKRKYDDMMDTEGIPAKPNKPKKKWIPHSEIEVD